MAIAYVGPESPAPENDKSGPESSSESGKKEASWQSAVENGGPPEGDWTEAGENDGESIRRGPSYPEAGPGEITTMAVGEEGDGGDDGIARRIEEKLPDFGEITTMAVGEEGDGGDDGIAGRIEEKLPGFGEITTMAVGEEGGGDADFGDATTMAVGEEGGGDSDLGDITTMAVGEEGDGGWSSGEGADNAPPMEYAPFRPGEITTAAIGEEGGGDPEGIKEAVKDALNGREKTVEAGDPALDNAGAENVDGSGDDYTELRASAEEVNEKIESVREFLQASSKEELFEKLKELFGDPIFDSLRDKDNDDVEEAPGVTRAFGEDGGGFEEIGATTLAVGEEDGGS